MKDILVITLITERGNLSFMCMCRNQNVINSGFTLQSLLQQLDAAEPQTVSKVGQDKGASIAY